MAANTVFIINNTVGTPIAAIQPNTLNGPGGVQQSSDLSMFGLGYAAWGQASDQNDYRLLENFACPESLTNPGNPMGESELGAGNGINAPLVGQLWFNTTDQTMYVNTTTGWQTVSLHTIVVPSGAINPSPVPTVGSLFFNTGSNQLLISNGSVWESVAANYLPLSGGTMTGALNMGNHQIHNVLNPTSAFDAANKQYVDTVAGGSGAGVFVPLAGGTMTGSLIMQTTSIVVKNGVTQTVTIPANGQLTINTGNLTFTSPAGGIAITANGRILNVTTTALTDAASVSFGDGRWLKLAGGTVTGTVTMTGGSTITGVPNPTNNTDVANKQYVDANAGYPRFVPPASTGAAVVYDAQLLLRNGTNGGSVINKGWTNVDLVSVLASLGITGVIPKAVILEGYYIQASTNDGTSPSINYSGFILVRNSTSQGTGTYPSQTSYVLCKSDQTQYKYYNAPSGTNQGVFPVRQVAEGANPVGSFDYSIPSPIGGVGGFTAAAVRIVGYYT